MSENANENGVAQHPGDNHGAGNELGSHHYVGADGFGLTEAQQKAVADLWEWQRESMRADVILGGPIVP